MNERFQWNEMEPKWNQRRRVYGYNIALYVISNNEDHEFKSIKDYRKRKYMQMEIDNSSEIKLAFQSLIFWTSSPHTRRCEVN
jgi:hypothetical protein